MSTPFNLSDEAQLVRLAGATAAGTGDTITTPVIDTQGYESVEIVAQLGTVTNAATVSLKLQSGALANGTDQADVANCATPTVTSDGTTVAASNKFVVLNAVRPTKRYVRGVLARGVANIAVEAVFALLYNGRKVPVDQPNCIAWPALQG